MAMVKRDGPRFGSKAWIQERWDHEHDTSSELVIAVKAAREIRVPALVSLGMSSLIWYFARFINDPVFTGFTVVGSFIGFTALLYPDFRCTSLYEADQRND